MGIRRIFIKGVKNLVVKDYFVNVILIIWGKIFILLNFLKRYFFLVKN